MLGADPTAADLGEHACRWLVQRLFCKIEGAPMDAKQRARIQRIEGVRAM